MINSSYLVKRFLIAFFVLFFLQTVFNIPLIELFGLRDIRSEGFMFYQYFTHVFIHANLSHLIRNAFGFWIFGSRLEMILGKKYFVIFILISGLGSATLQSYISYINISKTKIQSENYFQSPSLEKFKQYLNNFPPSLRTKYNGFINSYQKNPKDEFHIQTSKKIVASLYDLKLNTPSVGASGIIFGFLAGFAILFPNEPLFIIFLPIPIKAKYLTIIYGLYELYAGSKNNPSDNVAHFAHLGGMILGYIFMKWWRRKYILHKK